NSTTSTPGQLQWVKSSAGGTASFAAVAADHAGNTVAVGQFSGAVDLGAGPVTSVAGSSDAFVAKYSPQGTLSWVKNFGGSSDDFAYGVVPDSQNNIIVVGAFKGTVDFGGVSLTSAGNSDIFLAKYSPSGGLLWAKRFGGTWDDWGTAVAVD